jgi:hypothetical protein
MILDHRTYTFKPGQLAPFLKLYEPQALQIQISHLGNLVGYFISDIGPLNQAVHIWGYTSMQEREERRERLWADPRWLEFAQQVYPMIEAQENKILKPAAFSPIR